MPIDSRLDRRSLWANHQHARVVVGIDAMCGWAGTCEDGVRGVSQGQSGGEASLVGVRTSTANKGLPRLASPPSSLTPGGQLNPTGPLT